MRSAAVLSAGSRCAWHRAVRRQYAQPEVLLRPSMHGTGLSEGSANSQKCGASVGRGVAGRVGEWAVSQR
eukprot:7558182-Alexandrium_andersonii.AAC.1